MGKNIIMFIEHMNKIKLTA